MGAFTERGKLCPRELRRRQMHIARMWQDELDGPCHRKWVLRRKTSPTWTRGQSFPHSNDASHCFERCGNYETNPFRPPFPPVERITGKNWEIRLNPTFEFFSHPVVCRAAKSSEFAIGRPYLEVRVTRVPICLSAVVRVPFRGLNRRDSSVFCPETIWDSQSSSFQLFNQTKPCPRHASSALQAGFRFEAWS